MCHRKQLLIVSVVVSSALLVWFLGMGPGSAVAQERQGRSDWAARMMERHPEADTDGDGQLSRDEMRAFYSSRQGAGGGDGPGGHWRGRGMYGPPDPAEMLRRHPELDTNQDGVLSEEEMQAGRERFGRFGRDGRSMQPPPEFFDWLLERFARADADGNNQLSKEEILELKEQVTAERRSAFGDPAERNKRLLERYPEADTNGDGQLSEEEVRAFRGDRSSRDQQGSTRGRRGQSRRRSNNDETDSQAQ